MLAQPYLFFDGCCEEAIEFYRNAVGASVEMLMRYKESPEPPGQVPPGYDDKVMHASLRIGDSCVVASDDCTGGKGFKGFSLALSVADRAEAERRFNSLAVRGQVTMPLARTFFSPAFGMLTDRFGVAWMVLVEQPAQGARS